MADLVDLKSPYLAGHSRGVANLVAEAARVAGRNGEDVSTLRRAALIHDLGRLGVSNAIWDKPRTLTEAEFERVRLHPYLTTACWLAWVRWAEAARSPRATTSAWTARGIPAA